MRIAIHHCRQLARGHDDNPPIWLVLDATISPTRLSATRRILSRRATAASRCCHRPAKECHANPPIRLITQLHTTAICGAGYQDTLLRFCSVFVTFRLTFLFCFKTRGVSSCRPGTISTLLLPLRDCLPRQSSCSHLGTSPQLSGHIAPLLLPTHKPPTWPSFRCGPGKLPSRPCSRGHQGMLPHRSSQVAIIRTWPSLRCYRDALPRPSYT